MNPPPFLVSFPTKDAFRRALSEDAYATYWADAERLIAKGLPPAVSLRVVACLFGYSTGFVGALVRRPERYYRSFLVRKGRKVRQIHAPKVGLKVIQKWLAFHLARALRFGSAVYGFIPGRSAAIAAQVHCRATWVYSVDIADFFPTTPRDRVAEALESEGYPLHSALLIAALNCYQGNLAQGSPASPVLSNVVCRPLDAGLSDVASQLGVRHTRYADDIVFSGSEKPPEDLAQRVRQLIENQGWKVADRKEHLAELPHRLKVHGLLVHGDRPRLTKGYRNRLRAMAHLTASGKVRESDVSRFAGHLAYAKSVHWPAS